MKFFLDIGLVAQDRAALVPGSGIDLQKFKPVSLPCLQNNGSINEADNKRFVFLLVARMLKDKGVHEYVEVARWLKKSHPDVTCALLGPLGGGNPTAISAEQMQSWVDEGVVLYWGTSSDVRKQIAKADCIVLPSYREGTPRTLLEAAAMGRPLVTTDVPGCREVVRHGLNGLLCESHNSKSLAQQMTAMLLMSDASLREMGEASRQWVQKHFDEQIVIERYLKSLKEISAQTQSI